MTKDEEQFEAWFKTEWDDYSNYPTEAMYLAWQAATMAERERCAKHVEEKEALEQPAQEHVAWIDHMDGIKTVVWKERDYPAIGTKLYTYPHQWQGLTDDEIDKIYFKTFDTWSSQVDVDYGRAIEQALKDKNT